MTRSIRSFANFLSRFVDRVGFTGDWQRPDWDHKGIVLEIFMKMMSWGGPDSEESLR